MADRAPADPPDLAEALLASLKDGKRKLVEIDKRLAEWDKAHA